MLRNRLIPAGVIALALSFGANAAPQNDSKSAAKNSTEEKQQTKTTTNNGTAKTNTDTVYGKVEGYEPGKSIKVSVPGTVLTSKSFDLSGSDITAKVTASVKVGDWVRVRETTDNQGHKTVTVTESTEKAAKANHQS